MGCEKHYFEIYSFLDNQLTFFDFYRKNNSGDVEILKAELSRRVDEIDRQRSEMTGMADRYALIKAAKGLGFNLFC